MANRSDVGDCIPVHVKSLKETDEFERALRRVSVLNEDARKKMLDLCHEKADAQGNHQFHDYLLESAEKFLGFKLSRGYMSIAELHWEVVNFLPEDKWMRFVRTYLNLEEEEILHFRSTYGTLNHEQTLQLEKFRQQELEKAEEHRKQREQMLQNAVLSAQARMDKIRLCHWKALNQGDQEFPRYLLHSAECFLGTKIDEGLANINELFCAIVQRIPDDEWMRFDRTYLDLQEGV